MSCRHEHFAANVAVQRLMQEDNGPVTGFSADVRIQCAQCGLPFRFIGMEAGDHYAEPRVSVDGTELRAPIEPATHEKFAPRASYAFPRGRGKH